METNPRKTELVSCRVSDLDWPRESSCQKLGQEDEEAEMGALPS